MLAPLLACDDLWEPMISGRGLGITGGTLDKLESIPGFNVHLDLPRALAQLERIGVFMIGQTAESPRGQETLRAPRRDWHGPSQALIVASTMSKKLAENLDRLVLDVKFGTGAFMKTRAEAEELAESMTEVGRLMGVDVSHLFSPMNEPLGHTVGNALEVAECVEVLQGGGPEDLRTLVLDLATRVADVSRERLAAWLNDGSAWQKFVELVEAQGGDANALENFKGFTPHPSFILCSRNGAAPSLRWTPRRLGARPFLLGAGRQRTDDQVDFAVGFSAIKNVGERAEAQEPLFIVHARTDQALASVFAILEKGIEIL